jgi:hypothetical protein
VIGPAFTTHHPPPTTHHFRLRQLEPRNRRQRGHQPLQVAVHPRDVERHRLDLLRAARPLAFGGAAFLIQVLAHPLERLHDCLDALPELDA